jgi:CheY-like chemotaxis protein
MPGKVLVVENHDALRRLYAEEFADDGYAVTEAEDALAAIDSAAQARPDVVVLGVCTSAARARASDARGFEALGRSLKRLGCLLVVNAGNLNLPVVGNDRLAQIADAIVLKCADMGALKQTLRRLLPGPITA